MSEPFSKYEIESNIDSVCVSSIIKIELKKKQLFEHIINANILERFQKAYKKDVLVY